MTERIYAGAPRRVGDRRRWRFGSGRRACEAVLGACGWAISDRAMDGRRATGWFALDGPRADGTAYAFVLPDGLVVPDPASRRQDGDVHGPSLLDRAAHVPRPGAGRPWEEAVIYELHVGTFTARGHLPRGDRANSPPGRRSASPRSRSCRWRSSPATAAGAMTACCPTRRTPPTARPDDLAALVEAAHERGLMVLLDVVYNHFGPDGNYLHAYAAGFFDATRHTPWGAGIDYTRARCGASSSRTRSTGSASSASTGCGWTPSTRSATRPSPNCWSSWREELRAPPSRPPGPPDNRGQPQRHPPARTRHGRVGAAVHRGMERRFPQRRPCARHRRDRGLLRGTSPTTRSASWAARWPRASPSRARSGRGEPSAHLPPAAFVDFLQNHDQTGNRALGERLIALTDPDTLEALTRDPPAVAAYPADVHGRGIRRDPARSCSSPGSRATWRRP